MYDRSQARKQTSNTESSSSSRPTFKPVDCFRVPSTHLILIDCDISSWPSVTHYYPTFHGPFRYLITLVAHFFLYSAVQAVWVLSFWFVQAGASSSSFNMNDQRLSLLYVCLAKALLIAVEGALFIDGQRKINRIAWSERFGSTEEENAVDDPRNDGHPSNLLLYYDLMNQGPSLLWGTKRCLLMITLIAIFFACRFSLKSLQSSGGWTLWAGVMVSIELLLRLIMQISWSKLPRSSIGRWLGQYLKMNGSAVRKQIMKYYQRWHTVQEKQRRPFQKGDDMIDFD